jgi:leader peptidase (prepilin peptidase)/N-methyltransferase
MIPLVYFGIQLSIIDFKSHRLPNNLVGAFALTEIFIMMGLSFVESDLSRLVTAVGIAIATMSVYVLLYFISRGALGMGDVKFAFPLGLCVGWCSAGLWLVAIFVSFFTAGTIAIIGLVTKQMTRKSRLAFGPFMSLGTMIVCGLAVFRQ